MPLPPIDTPEWNAEVELFMSCPQEERVERAKYFGMAISSYERRMRERGIRKQRQTPIILHEESEPVYKLPPVKLREYKAGRRRKGDEETQVVLASDGHADKVTPTYNKEIYRTRMEKMFDSIMTITNLHRNMYPIKKLRVVNLGDNCQGESPYQGSRVDTITMGARDQTVKLAAPMWNDFLGSLKQHFTEIIFDGFGGNHGHEKLAPETSREDFRLYDILQVGIGKEKGITINIHEQFADIVYIEGFRFLCLHGDGIPCQQGIPQMALARRIKDWFMQFGGFNYVCSAHFHKFLAQEIASGLEHFMNSTLVSDDEWALKKLGISSKPSQWTFGVHPRMGVTWRYPLVVDEVFLPQKIKLKTSDEDWELQIKQKEAIRLTK